MNKHLSEAPWLPLQPMDVVSSQGPALLACQAQELGPVLRWTMPYGVLAGREIVFLVGPEANRFVLHTHRELFSHEKGWTPNIGQLMGKGLLNMDPPEHTPALYIAGERDLVVNFPGMQELLANLRAFVPQLKETLLLPGCGHWTQQERPAEVNATLLEFLKDLTPLG
jgi:pimeloyl-ACP methyl ester carboxylesterase